MTTATYRQYSGSAAQNYERYFVPTIAEPVAASLLSAAGLQPGERVLDVACGTGLVARLASEQVGADGAVTGIDVAADMIEVARAAVPAGGAALDWHVGDAADLPFPDASYDAVLCQMGLMFMEDRPGAVAEMRRVVRPGGRVVVSTPGTMQRGFELMEAAIVEHINPDLGGFVRAVFSMDDPGAVAALLEGAGLADVTGTEVTVSLSLPGPADFLWQYINLTPMGQFVSKAPVEAQAAMEAQVVEAWQPFLVDGRVPVDQPMVLASGRRPPEG